jgi:acyl carrier protein
LTTPVDRADVVERLRGFLSDGVILDPGAGLTEDEPLLRGRIDSVGLMELVAFIEDEFLIELSYDDIGEERLGTVARIAELVEERHTDG